jgi:ferredoxin/flavodoxin
VIIKIDKTTFKSVSLISPQFNEAIGGVEMDIKKVTAIYFSPTGTTQRAITAFAAGTGLPFEAIDLTIPKVRKAFNRSFDKDELVITGLPVYGGKLPMYLDDFFSGLKGDGTPAVATVVYGNREYDDALVELKIRLEERGFTVKAAAAFIGEHTFSHKIATGRPNADDLAVIAGFGKLAAASIAKDVIGTLHFKGTYPFAVAGYDPAKPGPSPTRPAIVTDENCNMCGLCADTCPWGAIDKIDCKTINNATCSRCFRCIKICPAGAKKVTDEKFLGFLPSFEARLNANRKEPELFLPG